MNVYYCICLCLYICYLHAKPVSLLECCNLWSPKSDKDLCSRVCGCRSSTFELTGDFVFKKNIMAALHLEPGPILLEADCMKFQPFLGWRPASTIEELRSPGGAGVNKVSVRKTSLAIPPTFNYTKNKIIMGVNFFICKGVRVKKLGRFNKYSIMQRI